MICEHCDNRQAVFRTIRTDRATSLPKLFCAQCIGLKLAKYPLKIERIYPQKTDSHIQ